MVRIAFVEDNDGDALIIRDHLARYERENDVKFEITRFENGLKFLSQYKHDYDMIRCTFRRENDIIVVSADR